MKNRYRNVISKNRHRIFNMEHVVGIGYGLKEKGGRKTREEAIIVMVDRKVPVDKLSGRDLVPPSLENIITDVQEVGELKLQNARTERIRPVVPGVSIGHYKISAGTLGAIVYDNESGRPLLLSNNHVLANLTDGMDGRAKKGDAILQPGSYDDGVEPDDVVAHLERYIPLKAGSEAATCPVAIEFARLVNSFLHLIRPDYSFRLFKQSINNIVDCAVARPIRESDVNPEIMGIGKVKGVVEPEVGMQVIKSGRSSGLTKGAIKALDSVVEVSMDETRSAVFEDQIITEPISEAGDSGSLVLDTNRNAVGLLFAGSDKATVCNRIGNVLEALSVRFK